MASKSKTKEIKTNWPVVSGIEANQKHEGRQLNLVAEKGSLTAKRFKVGLQ